MASKVYFCDMRVPSLSGDNIPKKLKRLMRAAGFETIDFRSKFAAIKLHFGEPGNLAFLRPNFARVVADYCREMGGRPFLTDAGTLYPGRRKHALEHLDAAYENGFSPFSTNCHILIADGLKGTDEAEIAPRGGVLVKRAKIGRAIADADVIISLNHFKGHETASFGGAIKNIGMGSASRAGKMEQHCEGKPAINLNKCLACKLCSKQCGQDAISYVAEGGKAQIDYDKCVGCGRCIGGCAFNAISNPNSSTNDVFTKKMAEYAKAVLQDKPNFHINIAIDISPYCDCHSENDAPIIPNVGMFASFDPVALDQASADACNKMQPLPNSRLAEQLIKHADKCDHFINNHVNSDWRVCLEYCQKQLDLGTREYELITVK